MTRDNAGGAAAVRKGKKKVLVVDDEKDLVDLISYNLQRNGYDVVTAFNGNAALEVAGREQPDLIVLDLMLPGHRRHRGGPAAQGRRPHRQHARSSCSPPRPRRPTWWSA